MAPAPVPLPRALGGTGHRYNTLQRVPIPAGGSNRREPTPSEKARRRQTAAVREVRRREDIYNGDPTEMTLRELVEAEDELDAARAAARKYSNLDSPPAITAMRPKAVLTDEPAFFTTRMDTATGVLSRRAKSLACRTCGRSFKTAGARAQHARAKHGRKR